MQAITVTQTLLSKLPKLKYRKENYLDTLEMGGTTNTYDSDATQPYSSSDETIHYWLHYLEAQAVQGVDVNPSEQCIKETKHEVITDSKTTKFHINMHGIHQYHHKYYFKCVVSKCQKTFN